VLHSSCHKGHIKVQKVTNDIRRYNKLFLIKIYTNRVSGGVQSSHARFVSKVSLFVVVITTHRTHGPHSPCPEHTAQEITALRENTPGN